MSDVCAEGFFTIRQGLNECIDEYNERLGYLGADWDKEVFERYDANLDLSFRVYFEYDYCTDVYIEAGSWTMSNYLDEVATQTLDAANKLLDDGAIDALTVESFEITF